MKQRRYSIGELRRVIKESATEFKPVYGKNVEKDNKAINDKAYSDMEKAVKDYDGKKTAPKTKKAAYPQDDNMGMENLRYNNMNDKFKADNLARLKGFVNAEAEKLHKNEALGNAVYTEFDGMKEKDARLNKGRLTAKEIGLTSREIPKKEFEKQTESVVEGKISRLNFKNTTFLCESHMMTKIPDTFKVEGKRFIMNDRTNHEYLIEWHVEDDPRIFDKKRINEEQDTIKRLSEYKRKNEISTAKKRINEDKKIEDMLNNMRKLMN